MNTVKGLFRLQSEANKILGARAPSPPTDGLCCSRMKIIFLQEKIIITLYRMDAICTT